MSRQKRKKRARRLKQRTAPHLDTIVTRVTPIETKERVIPEALFLKLVGIGLPFPKGGKL